MKTPKKLPMVLVLLFHLLLFSTALPTVSMVTATKSSNRNLIQATCKKTPFYKLCLNTLLSNPKSSGADVAGLGLVIIDAVASHAAQTRKVISELMREVTGVRDSALLTCADRYDTVLKADVPMAREAFTKGNPKFAELGANDAALEATSCERDLGQGSPSLLSESNKKLHDLSAVAASIARILL